MDTRSPISRTRWLSELALADPALLVALSIATAGWEEVQITRAPELALVMLRGRISGTGLPFCVGEAVLARAEVMNAAGLRGIGWRLGEHTEAAVWMARWDVRLQCSVEEAQDLVGRLQTERERVAAEQAARSLDTRVQFFSMETMRK